MWIRRCEVVMSEVECGRHRRTPAGLRRRASEALDVLAKVEKAAQEATGELETLLSR